MPADPLLPQIIVLVILIILNALFTAAEVAVTSLPEGKLRKQAEEGDEKADRLLSLNCFPERTLLAMRIGIALSGFFAAVITANLFVPKLVKWLVDIKRVGVLSESAWYIVAMVVITVVLVYVILVLGALVPARIAARDPERAAWRLRGFIAFLTGLFRPFSWLMFKTSNGILRLMRIDPKDTGEEVSEDEIMMMVDIGEETGAIESTEKEMIENIFEFNNTTAEDVMIHRTDMVMIWIEDSQQEILNVIETSGLSRFPVYDESADDIVGILSTRDYLFNTHRKQPKKFRELLRPAYFVPESVRTDVLFRDMQSKKVHMAIVVDEYGGTSGLVTMEDLLEEIVGNIYDEFDPQDEQDLIQLEENLWRVAGSAELEMLAEEWDIELPEDEEYDTLGGLVFSQLSVIPEDGSKVEVDVCGLHIKVEEISDRRVEWALVSKIPSEENDEE